MDKQKLIAQLMATFLAELSEYVRAFNRDLLALEKAGSSEARGGLLATLFRTAHSLKGASRSVGLREIEERCHQLEEIISDLRDGKRTAAPEVLKELFAEVDALEKSRLKLAEGRETAEAPRDRQARVSIDKLDLMLAQTGELLVARRRLETRVEEAEALSSTLDAWRRSLRDKAAGERLAKLADDLGRFASGLAADVRGVGQCAQPLEESVRRARMVPFQNAAEGLDRAVRDLAKDSGKEVELVLRGGDVELDRAVLDALQPALLHLARNAVDHGIEPPDERRRIGKPAAGRLGLAAVLRGSRVEITIEDDGRGIDLGAVRREAAKRQLAAPQSDFELAGLIFKAGFSTSSVTDISGRGVGLDAVKSSVEALHGSVEFSFEPGRGSRFALTVPLTLTTVRALLLSIAGHPFAVLSSNVRALSRVGPEDLRSVEGKQVLLIGDKPLPLASLAETLGLPERERAATSSGKTPVVVLQAGSLESAFVVDEFLSEQEVVVKSLGARLVKVRNIEGGTVLPDGRVALILNAAELLSEALGRSARGPLVVAPAAEQVRKRVLVVEDSVTTRTLERSILESAGYAVRTAADGAEAWRLLQEHGADLVVSDVEMPRMDGFALTETIRASKRFRDLPVVLVTALEKDEEKARGLQAGADAYLIKSAFDQSALLETIRQLL